MFPRIRHSLCFPNFKRNIHDLSRYVFVQDHQYDLLRKMREQSIRIPQVDPSYGMPSSFARNLLHPFSNHTVSDYAAKYYETATPYYGEFPIQYKYRTIVKIVKYNEVQERILGEFLK